MRKPPELSPGVGFYCRHGYQNITFLKVLAGKTSKPTTLLEESFVFLRGSLKNPQKPETQHLSLIFFFFCYLCLSGSFLCWLRTGSWNSRSLSRRCLSGRSGCCLWMGNHNFPCKRRRSWASSLKGQVFNQTAGSGHAEVRWRHR